MNQPTAIGPGKKVRLKDFDPAYTAGSNKDQAARELDKNLAALDNLAYRLYAEGRRSLLVVLQGMDTSGKDGTIRKAMQGFNPQTCSVTSFKGPTTEELAHDFLWRVHHQTPRRGHIGIFNRSHYEDVLIVRVHDLVPKAEWRDRYDRINEFELLLSRSGTTIVKFFLHVSRAEQRRRLQRRLADPQKRWKFDRQDVEERKLWDDYQQAYEAALSRCNSAHAPWHIVPADHKWYRNLVVSRVLRRTLEKMDPQFPPAEKGIEKLKIE